MLYVALILHKESAGVDTSIETDEEDDKERGVLHHGVLLCYSVEVKRSDCFIHLLYVTFSKQLSKVFKEI